MSEFLKSSCRLKLNEEQLGDSWVDIDCNNLDSVKVLNYTQNSEMERLLREAQREGSTPSTSNPSSVINSTFNSPPRPQSLAGSTGISPCVSGTNSPKYQAYTQIQSEDTTRQLPSPTNQDWVWDWSSKPTNCTS
uniref:Uncharacterized protein n=1 Tax=Ciona savignyi TaxID=51511 RepID=H2ZFD2_CIOSA